MTLLINRLPGGAKKKRCEAMLNATARCDQPSLTMIGECKACSKQFCSTHRLPEDHTCGELESVKEAARQLNSDKLTRDSIAAGSNLHSAFVSSPLLVGFKLSDDVRYIDIASF